jgi:hypothetical protein
MRDTLLEVGKPRFEVGAESFIPDHSRDSFAAAVDEAHPFAGLKPGVWMAHAKTVLAFIDQDAGDLLGRSAGGHQDNHPVFYSSNGSSTIWRFCGHLRTPSAI